ncbi:hypothetical protein ACE41H_17730 [Paenibacillus enshidis]|uniref:Uncharacterized protein n=1 Tax=Paenibacillus enshidis TaxID=1458439 RepID=A0ABV5AWM6_9BACL
MAYNGGKEVGTITSLPAQGDNFLLGGKLWCASEINYKLKRVYVKRAKGKITTLWTVGAEGDTDTKVVGKIRRSWR